MSQKITKKYSDVDPKKLSFTDLEENARSKGQKIAYVRYHDAIKGDSTLIMQTPWITLDTYGIPRAGEYYKDEASRSFMKVPLDTQDSCIKVLHDKMKELDTILAESETKKDIFGSAKTAKQYQYQPIVRVPPVEELVDSDDESGDEKNTTYARPPYMKAKFHLDYESGNMKTKLYKRLTDGTIKREEVAVKTLADIEKLVTYRSRVRLILMPNKLWALKTYNGKKYGVSWKIMQLEVEPVQRSTLKNVFGEDAFLDSDDEAEVTNDEPAAVVTQLAKDDGSGSESESESSESDSSDSEEEEVVKKKSKKKVSKKTKSA
jgi:hypothetical protein